MDEDLLLFIKSAIKSVWALEILLLMRRERGRSWTREALAGELRSHPALAQQVLDTFLTAGLLSRRTDGCVYAPASPSLEALSERLEQAYRERPVAVVNAIISSRQDPLQSFANAFRLKKDRES